MIKVGSLKAAVAKGRHLDQRQLAFEHAFRIRMMWKQLGQMLMKSKIVANNGCNRSRHRLVDVCRCNARPETFLGGRSAEEQQPHWLRVHAGRTKLGDIVDFAKHPLRQRRVKPPLCVRASKNN